MLIRTRRLELVPGSQEMLRAELESPARLADLLDADLPDDWPPPLYDEDAINFGLAALESDPRSEEWGFRYFVLVEQGRRTMIGAGGFKGAPKDRVVEIGYSVLPSFQRRGFASEAVGGMIAFSQASGEVSEVIAHTLPHLTPSIGVLEKAGFSLHPEAPEPGVVRYSLVLGTESGP